MFGREEAQRAQRGKLGNLARRREAAKAGMKNQQNSTSGVRLSGRSAICEMAGCRRARGCR